MDHLSTGRLQLGSGQARDKVGTRTTSHQVGNPLAAIATEPNTECIVGLSWVSGKEPSSVKGQAFTIISEKHKGLIEVYR